jgi:hypothetical protein
MLHLTDKCETVETQLLVGYLHAWFPIIASRSKAINVIDGFAGRFSP